MKYDALTTVYRIFSDKWSDFDLKKSKKLWVKETKDKILLFVQLQGSRWGATYYLNFGAYFIDIEPIDRPLSNLPKSSDWHLLARYERFQELSTSERNSLFSLEEKDSALLEARCLKIADFTEETILPQLRAFGDLDFLCDQVSIRGSDKAFSPFHPQRIAKEDILTYVSNQSRL